MNERQFASALHRGLGSAIVFLQQADDASRYKEIVLSRCLRPVDYDAQSEGTRARYLWQAICLCRDKEYFEGPIIAKLMSCRQHWLTSQLAEMLVLFARGGSETSAAGLRAKYAQFAGRRRLANGFNGDGDRWEAVAMELLDVDGFASFKRYITDVGQYLRRHPEDLGGPSYDWYLSVAKGRFGGRATRFLDPSSTSTRRSQEELDSVIALAKDVERWEGMRRAHRSTQNKQAVTLSDVEAKARELAARDLRHYGSIYATKRAFMAGASDADKLQLANMVIAENDETTQGWLLQAFAREPFPLGPSRLLGYLESDNETLRGAAINVLQVCRDGAVHAAAIRLLQTRGIESGGLTLLEVNYRRSDDQVIVDAVKRSRTMPHGAVMSLRNIYVHHHSARALPALLRAYNDGDCAYCRWGIVQAMVYCRVLPEKIINECQFDSYDDTRKLARRLIARRGHPTLVA